MAEDIGEHSYYYPSDKLIPVTPQARKVGFEYPIYVTERIWARALSWTGQSSKRKTNVERRIFQLLEACSDGLQKKLAGDPNDEEGFVYFQFKHFFWDRDRDEAKKKTKMKMGCRLFLHPDDGKPWMCVVDPDYDYALELKKGTPLDASNDDKGDSDDAE